MKQYYFVDKGGTRQGPRPVAEISSTDITPETLVWCKGMEKWLKAKDVEDFQNLFHQETEIKPTPAPVVSPVSETPKQDTVKPVNPTPYQPTTPATPTTPPKPVKKTNMTMVAVAITSTILILAVLLWYFLSRDDVDKYSQVVAQSETEVIAENEETTESIADYDEFQPDDEMTGADALYDFVCERELTPTDVAGLSKEDLRIMRNWIFARHGYIFKSNDLKEYFSQFNWYEPKYSNVSSMLSKVEKKNVAFIQRYE